MGRGTGVEGEGEWERESGREGERESGRVGEWERVLLRRRKLLKTSVSPGTSRVSCLLYLQRITRVLHTLCTL